MSRNARRRGYTVALGATAATVAARALLWPVLGDAVPNQTFFPAVLVAAYYGGLRPGLLATLLGALCAHFLFTPPYLTFGAKGVNAAAAAPLFVLTGVLMSALCESLHRTRRRLVEEERARAATALREAEERFHQLADNIRDIFWTVDPQGRVSYISPAYEEVWGRTRQSLYDAPAAAWDEAVHPDDRARMTDLFARIRRGVSTDCEYRVVRPDGSVRWVRSRSFPVWSAAENLPRVVGLVEDITDRKLAEIALRESEERFRGTFENAAVGITHGDLRGRYLRVNQKFCDVVGFSREELLRSGFQANTFPEDLPATLERFALLARGELATYSIEKRHLRKDGTSVWAHASVSLQRDPTGAPLHTIAVIQDISERKRLQAELQQASDRLELAVRGSNVGIWDLHLTDGTFEGGRLHAVNLWEQFGLEADARPDAAARIAMWHPDDRERVMRAVRACLDGETRDFEAEFRIRHRDGSYRWRLHRGVAVRDATGRASRFIGSSVDISDLKQAQEELRHAKEAAESANRAKDEFLANVSHEIRTPMNAIIGMTELVLDGELRDDQRQCLRTVKSAADNLLAILNDLLDFSKIEAGKLELDPADFSLRAVVGDTLRALAPRAHQKGLELAGQVRSDVPDALVGDAGRLRQVLLNLVGNAIKFTATGEVVVRVEPAAGPVPEGTVAVHVWVSDTGIGIKPEVQGRIFRAFEQEDTSTTRKYGGTGLGLSIAARLVALMGGTITVESEPGRGSTFGFVAHFGRHANQAEPSLPQAPVLLRGLRVLVVDDNATNRRILEEALRGWQMSPLGVGDAVAATGALWHAVTEREPYPLVLLDSRMPDTDGLVLAARIREWPALAATRIILLTSGDRPGDLARSRELRIDAHLLKPVQSEELLDAIYRVMSRADGDGSAAPRPAPPEPAPALPAAPSLRILVAEDNEFNAQLIEQLLTRRGHRVRVAGDGRQALALATEGGFDLLLLDVHMPERDGFQVIREVRARERATGGHLPVIALTARSRPEDRERCLEAGMDDFLPKPVRMPDLLAAMERLTRTGPVSRPTGALLTPSVLLAACESDPALLDKLCRWFRERAPEHISALAAARAEADVVRLREAAHKLSGMLSTFSTPVGELASAAEDRAAAGEFVAAAELAARVEAAAGELLGAVEGLTVDRLLALVRARADGTGLSRLASD